MRKLIFLLFLIITQPVFAVGQIFEYPTNVTTVPSSTLTNYNSLFTNVIPWNTTEASVGAALCPGTFTLLKWSIVLTTAPGVGKSWTFSLRVNEADSSPTNTITITDNATTGSSTTNVSLSAGQRLRVKCAPSGTPTAPGAFSWVTEFQADTTNKTFWAASCGGGAPLAAGDNKYLSPQSSGVNTQFLEANAVPTAGSITALYVDANAPVGIQTLVIAVNVNNSDTSMTCTITGAGTTCSDTTGGHAAALVAGDLVSYHLTNSATSATTDVRVGVVFAPTIDGEACWMWGVQVAQNITTYVTGGSAANATEDNRKTILFACVGKKLQCYISAPTPPTPPNAITTGQSLTVTMRQNKASAGTPSNLSVAVTGPATTGSDTSNSVTFANNDVFDLQFVTSATSGNVWNHYGWVLYIAPTPTGTYYFLLLQGVGYLPFNEEVDKKQILV